MRIMMVQCHPNFFKKEEVILTLLMKNYEENFIGISDSSKLVSWSQ